MQPQHIIGLEAENVKRITVVKIELDPKSPTGTVIITGENGAGKSSVLDSIEMALRGKDAMLDKPIRDGKEKALVILKTEDLIVKKRFVGENVYLEITNHDGLTYKAPQELLDKLINTIGFDPLEFAQMDPALQAKRLLQICPAELDLAKNTAEQKALAEQRTYVGRDVKRMAAQLEGLPPADETVPTQEISLSALNQELQAEQEEARKAVRARDEIAKDEREIKRIDESIAALQKQREECVAKIDRFKGALAEWKDNSEKIKNLQTQMDNAEKTNVRVRAQKQRATLKAEHSNAVMQYEGFSKKIDALKDARDGALKKAKFPVDGLSIDAEGRVIFNGNPLKQCSTSEQIRVGMALAAAANPGIKVAFIRHGSLLDAKSMQIVSEHARQHGMQIWVERVDDTSPAAIQIVEGSNIGAKDSPEEKKAEEKPAGEKPKAKKAKKSEADNDELNAPAGADLFHGKQPG